MEVWWAPFGGGPRGIALMSIGSVRPCLLCLKKGAPKTEGAPTPEGAAKPEGRPNQREPLNQRVLPNQRVPRGLIRPWRNYLEGENTAIKLVFYVRRDGILIEGN